MAGILSANTMRGKIENALRERNFKFQYGHYYMGNYRFQMREASVALGARIDKGRWFKKGWWYYGKISLEAFCKLADGVVARVQKDNEKARAANPATGGVGVEVTENEQKDGVEVKFANKPDHSVLDSMKGHGFRWSKFQKLWYARRSPETLEFAYGLAGKKAEIPQSPAMEAVLESNESSVQEPDPEAQTDDEIDYADRSHDVTALTGVPVYVQPDEQVPAGDEGQFKLGGAINNPEYADSQA